MSQMMVWGINLLILSIGILIAGMIKPKWIFFWMDKPGRIHVQILAVALFMGGTVLFGQANKEKNTQEIKVTQEAGKVVEDIPTLTEELKK